MNDSKVSGSSGGRGRNRVIFSSAQRFACGLLLAGASLSAPAWGQSAVNSSGRRLVAQPARLERMPFHPIVRGQDSPQAVQVETQPLQRVESDKAAPSLMRPTDEEVRSTKARAGSRGAFTTVFASLAIVLGVFFCVVWITRRNAPTGMTLLPNEVLELLGRAPLAARQQMQLIRLGNRLVLLSVTAHGAETLAEITDPVEVDRLAGLCQRNRSGSVSDSFRQVLTQITAEPTKPGFLGEAGSNQSRVSRAG